MKKKKYGFILLGVVLFIILSLPVLNWIREERIARQPETELPLFIMIDDVLYQCYGVVSWEPEEAEDGTVKEILKNQVPYEHEQANFGDVGMPYWRVEDYIIVKESRTGNMLRFDEKWY